MVELDLKFHRVLVESLGNKRLSAFYTTLLTETRMSLLMLEVAYPDPHSIPTEHQELLATIRVGDSAGLDEQIKRHMDHAEQRRKAIGSNSDGQRT
jgi:DNA-binding FadR family transcriptional regulator